MAMIYNDRNLLKKLSDGVYEMTKERYERGVMVQRILEDREELYNKYIKE